MNKNLTLFLIAASVISGCNSSAQMEPVPPPVVEKTVEQSPYSQPLERVETETIEVSARVTAVDYDKRLVTIERADGSTDTLTVGPEVQRLKEIKKGDLVVVQIVHALAIEVRKPTDEEKKNPATLEMVAERAAAPSSPGAGAASVLRTIVTIVAIDHKADRVTFKGPRGKLFSVQAKDPKNLDRVKVGDTVVVTYVQGMAVGIEPKK